MVVKIGTEPPAPVTLTLGGDAGDRARDRVAASGDPIQGLKRNVSVEPEGR